MPYDVLVFLGMVFTAAMLLAQSSMGPLFGENRALKKRLQRRLKEVENVGESAAQSLVREKLLDSLQPWERMLEQLPRMKALSKTLDQAGHRVPAYRFAVLCVALAVVAAAAGFWLTNIPYVAAGAAACGFFLPFLKVRRDRRKRLDDFELKFPEALDIMIRGMRAGHPFSTSLQVASNELKGVISYELGLVFYDINYGGDVRHALLNLMRRLPSMTVTAFVTSVLIQRETGGNLAELLGQLSTTIRARISFQGKVRAASAEGKASAWVLAMVPFALAAMLAIGSPGYLDVLVADPKGHEVIAAAFVLELLGILWIRKIIRIDV